MGHPELERRTSDWSSDIDTLPGRGRRDSMFTGSAGVQARPSLSEAGSLHRNSEVGALEANDPAHLKKT